MDDRAIGKLTATAVVELVKLVGLVPALQQLNVELIATSPKS